MILPALILLALLNLSLASNNTNTTAAYRKIEQYSGSSFFSAFTTFTGPDPTGGYVNYIDLPSAADKNLTAFISREGANTSNAYIGVDYHQLPESVTSTVPAGRKSVRLLSKSTFDIGLLTVVDVVHAPTGPGVWPAVWLLANVTGDVWPTGGEMDILEWVNDGPTNAMTLHTAPGCVVERDAGAYLGIMGSTDCNAGDGSEGCSIDALAFVTSAGGKNYSTAGPAFNAQGGGVYVHEWTETGVTEWLFPRGSLPIDLATETPDPRTWTAKPLARWAGPGCQFNQAFGKQQLIINICLCGDWAGEVWTSSGMANRTGVATCDAWIANHPEAFKEAYFEFASIKVFSSNPSSPGVAGEKVKRDGDWGGHLNRHRHHRFHRHRNQHTPTKLKGREDLWSNATRASNARFKSRSEHHTPPLPSAKALIATPKSDAAELGVAGWTAAALAVLVVAALI